MPNVEVRGRYRAFTYDGTTPLDFTTYANNVSVIRRPNEVSFVTLRQYIPGFSPPFTTFEPGSAYVVVSRDTNANFNMGPYTRVDRLPSTLNVKSPQYYLGLDKNSITIPLSVYALSVNTPLSSVTGITYVNGVGAGQSTVTVDQIRDGFQTSFTHFLPNSGYQLRNRTPFTFFAPLQSEMGDAYAFGANNGAYGMGYFLESGSILSAYNIFGVWDKIVVGGSNSIYSAVSGLSNIYSNHVLALSSCGNLKKLFVTGANNCGQLGIGDNIARSVWTAVSGEWLDIAAGGSASYALSTNGKLFATGYNKYGQLGITTDTSVFSATTFTQESLNGTWSKIAAGSDTLLAISANGKLFACGANSFGQCGIGNLTPNIYTLTKEFRDGVYTDAYAIGSNSYALSGGRLLGSGRNFHGQLGLGTRSASSPTSITTFTPEVSGFTNVVDVFALPNAWSVFIRTSDGNVYGAGRDSSGYFYSSALGIDNNSYSTYSVRFQKSQFISRRFGKKKIIAAGYSGQGNITAFYTLLNDGSLSVYSTQEEYIISLPNVFDIFGRGNSSCTFFLSARNNILRPTPTPTPTITPTITPTPPPTPAPLTILQVAIFGGNLATGNSRFPTSNQYYAYNSPGNLNSNFTFRWEEPNGGYVPPGSIQSSTFDYEKGNFNNIVGIGINNYTGTGQSPEGRYNPRYIYKKIGTRWEYTLLPSDLDANTIRREYQAPDDGCDTLLITPPHPGYANTSQGVYNLIYVRNRRWREAISYDRGLTWNTYGLEDIDNYYSGTGTNKMIYSRSRSSNYKVCVAGCRSNGTQLIFAQRFPDFNFPEIIFNNYTLGLGYIAGVDFKHDYNDIPTVLSSLRTSGTINGSLILIRKINGSWQTVIVKQGIARFCVPNTTDFTTQVYRVNSPNISLELDPTNNNLIYIAYLRYGSNPRVAAYINVLCYNMATNTVVFDESVVRATGSQGVTEPAFYSVDSYLADVPILFYDKSNSSLNLFFIGYNDLSNPRNKNLMMSRINGSWTAPANNFTSSGTYGPTMSNNRQLSVKY